MGVRDSGRGVDRSHSIEYAFKWSRVTIEIFLARELRGAGSLRAMSSVCARFPLHILYER